MWPKILFQIKSGTKRCNLRFQVGCHVTFGWMFTSAIAMAVISDPKVVIITNPVITMINKW